MRVGLNLLYLLPGVVGGTETYAMGLLQGLSAIDSRDDFAVLVNEKARDWPLPHSKNFNRVVCPVSGESRMERYLFEQLRLPKLLRHLGLDLVHSLGYVSPLISPCPAVVTIHDLNFRAFPEGMSMLRRRTLEFFVPQSARRAHTVVTVSEFSKREIVSQLGVEPNKVVVTYSGPRPPGVSTNGGSVSSPRFREISPGVEYIIAFSSMSPNKNLERLLHAYALLRERGTAPFKLVLVGHLLSGSRLLELAGRLHLGDSLVATGYVDDQSLTPLLQQARVLAFPSLYEGFGVPVLEAMKCGVPVACSKAGSLPEIAGEAALFFDPLSPTDIADKIATLTSNRELQLGLRERGYENIKRFSWEDTARKTVDLYHRITPQAS